MHIVRHLPTLALAVILLMALFACSRSPAPSELQVNGYTVERDESGQPIGRVEFGISAFDRSGSLINAARVRGMNATITSVNSVPVGSGSVGSLQAYAATGGVCGDITASSGPLVAVLMLDETGSMRTYDPDGERFTTAKAFIDQMADDDLASVARFSTFVSITPGLLTAEVMADFTSDKSVLRKAIDDSFLETGWTPLWDAARDMVTMLGARSESNRVAVMLTDGFDNASSETAASANEFARSQGVAVYAVGFGTASATELDALVAGTGGYRDLLGAGNEGRRVENLLDNIFSATQAQGCVDLTFSPAPVSGTRIGGTMTVQFEGGAAEAPFDILF